MLSKTNEILLFVAEFAVFSYFKNVFKKLKFFIYFLYFKLIVFDIFGSF